MPATGWQGRRWRSGRTLRDRPPWRWPLGQEAYWHSGCGAGRLTGPVGMVRPVRRPPWASRPPPCSATACSTGHFLFGSCGRRVGRADPGRHWFSGNRAAKPTPHGRWRAPGGGRRPRLWVGEQCVAERRSIGSDLNPLPPPAGSRHEQHHLYRGPDRRRIVCRRISWSALASVVWLTILLWRPQQSGAICSPGLVACFVVGIPPVGEVP